MGNSDADIPAKAAKAPLAQEQQPNSTSSPVAVYPDWSGFQAYSPIPPHGFFPSVASSSQAHPYMWGAQHMIPPYGTPPPYVMYPHGGLYGHPSLPPGSHPFNPYAMPSSNGNVETSGVAAVGNGGVEADGKESEAKEAKEKSPLKRSKGSLGSLNMITGKNNNELGKSGFRSNGVPSQSGESGSEDSSEGSDANSQNDSLPKEGGQDSFEADQTQNGTAARAQLHTLMNEPVVSMPMQASGPGGVAGPTTSLNIGMEYWSAPNPSHMLAIHGKVSGASGVELVSSGVGGSRENIPSDLCLQDERELKRQRRKQSNRESARRSRLRKQAECEELAQRVEVLKEENNALKAELSRVKMGYQQLVSDNTSLKERYEGASRGTDDSMLGRSNQRSVDNHEKQIDTDKTEGQVNTLESGS